MKINHLRKKIIKYIYENQNKIKINSKEIKKGDVFVALKGKKLHGHRYIQDAKNNGAKYILTNKKNDNDDKNLILKVHNIQKFLLEVSNLKRDSYKGKIIAITGSVGKTSTKELIKYLLSFEVSVSASIKSHNNLLGVIITLLNINIKSKYSIFEVGTNNYNEIKKLSSIIRPHQVIITNIFPTHLLNFQNTKNIAIEKSDLFNPKYSPNVELLILPQTNDDEKFLFEIAKKHKIKSVVTYGYKDNSNFSIKKIDRINNTSSIVYLQTPLKTIRFQTSTFVKHQIVNLVIPFIIYHYNKLSLQKFSKKVRKIPLVDGRGLHHKIVFNNTKITFIDESYNASPESMRTCIQYFNDYILNKNQRKILILGEMHELGTSKRRYHQEIYNLTQNTKIDILLFCGKTYEKLIYKKNSKSNSILYFSRVKDILLYLNKNLLKNDIILAKGSNSSIVNKLVKQILVKERDGSC